MQLMDLPDFDPFDPSSMEALWHSLVNAREMGLMAMANRIDELSDADVESIERVVNTPPSVVEYVRNRREVRSLAGALSLNF